MNQKTILILGAATVGAVALTASLQSGRADDTRPASTAAPLLPALKERVNDVRELRIESPAGPATLRAEGDGWVLAEASGYPADGSKVRTLLLDLRDARRLEAKTANPERHGRLGLTAPTDEGAVSTRVTLVDGDGGVIETVLIGKQRTSKADPGAAQLGVRPDAQYYALPGEVRLVPLAAGNLRVDGRTLGWVNQEFLNVDRARIRSATISHPDGDEVVAVREDMGQNEMVVRDLPEGMQPKTPSGTAPLIGALQRVRFDDVRREDSLQWPEEIVTTATFTTDDGLRVEVDTMKVADEEDAERMVTWARVRAELLPEEAPADASSGDTADAEPAADEGPSRAELEAERDGIRAALGGWAFAVPTWKETSFRLRTDGVAEPIPEEDAGEETAEEAGPAEDQDPKPAAGGPGLPVPVEMTQPPAKPPTAEPPTGGGSGGI